MCNCLSFCQIQKWIALFIVQLIDYSCTDWCGLYDHLRDILRGNVSKLVAFAAVAEFFEWVQAGIDVYIHDYRYQEKPLSSPWFSAAGAALIAQRNYLFHTN